MSKLSFFLLTFAGTLAQSQVEPSCPQRDFEFCSFAHDANFDDLPATEGLLLTTPNACLESYGKLGYENFSVFSLPLLQGAGSTHMAGFQLGAGSAHRITRGENMEIFDPHYFDFLCALPTLALGVAASVDCTIRITPEGPGLDGLSADCAFQAGGLLSPLVPARCDIPFWGGYIEALTIEVVQPAVLNTLYAFGMNNFGYRDEWWGRKFRGRSDSRSGAGLPAAGRK